MKERIKRLERLAASVLPQMPDQAREKARADLLGKIRHAHKHQAEETGQTQGGGDIRDQMRRRFACYDPEHHAEAWKRHRRARR